MWSKALCFLLLTLIASVVAQHEAIHEARDAMAQLVAKLSSKVSLITDEIAKNKKRQDKSSASDAPNAMSQLVAALSSKASLTGTVPIATTMPTCIGGFDPPDATLARQMLTALPGTVLGQLGNAGARSSIASAFKAGQTPSWYNDLSPEIKNYVLSVQTHATTGCTPRQTGDGTGTGGAAGANAKVGGDKGGTSTSEALASRPTAAIVGLSGALGMLGLMMAL
ncbi:hypothetical protein VE02_04210 [Pseudogymnoascus sp. 03VT05]|nr:hypothetical protein VE02_04210 [Pseudogymnoascus sp. 03VT05]